MVPHKSYIKVFLLCFIIKLTCCDNVAHRLLKRFNDVRYECIDSHQHRKPAYECSGLMIRGLAHIGGPNQKHAWSKKQSNKRRNAFSVAFLRKDQLFNRFPHDHESGYILYPHLKTPHGKNIYSVFCAFPLDGHTDYRSGRHGCGPLPQDKTGLSRHCDTQGVTTIKKWISHYNKVRRATTMNFAKRQCSFDMTTKDAARNFAISIQANKYIREHSKKYGWKNNEIRIRGWNEHSPEKLPIEAFFYIIGTGSVFQKAKKKAEEYQRDYFATTGEKIPIVGIELPSENYPDIVIKNYEPHSNSHNSNIG